MKRPSAVAIVLAALIGALIYRHHFAPVKTVPVVTEAAHEAAAPRSGPTTVELVGVRATDGAPGFGTFAGRVTCDAGGVAGAELTFSRGETVSSVLTGAGGAFLFRPSAPGSYELTGIVAQGCLPYAPDESAVRLEARAGRAVTGLLFQLTAETPLTVVVSDGGAPLAGVHIAAHTPGTSAIAPSRTSVTGDDGVAKVGAGRGDRLEATLDGWDPATHVVTAADVRDGRVTLTLVRGRGDRTIVRGVVLDEDGQPLDGAQLAALDGDALVGEALSGADGSFEFSVRPSSRLRVRATRASFVPDEQPVSNGRLTLRLRRGCIVRGRVKDKEGPSVASFTVVVRRVAGQGPTPSSPTSYDADGRFEVRAVTPGRYSLQALAAGYAPSAVRVVEVTDGCGPIEMDLELGHGGTVYGRVTDSKTGAPIVATVQLEGFIEGAGMDVRSSTTTDASGNYEIGGLPAGRRSIMAMADGHHGRIVAGVDVRDGERSGPIDVALDAVEAGETARTQLTGIGAVLGIGDGVLVIQRTMPGSGAEAAGLVNGDEIVAIDGNEVRSMGFEDATNAIRGPADTTVSLEVKKAKGQMVTLLVQRKIVR